MNDLIRWIQNYLHKKVTFNYLHYVFFSWVGEDGGLSAGLSQTAIKLLLTLQQLLTS